MLRQHYFTPLRVGVFSIAVAIGIVLALTPIEGAERFPELGETADRTWATAEALSFESERLTEQAREEARAAVEPLFMYDPDIRPAQLAAMQLYLDDLVSARAARAEAAAAAAALDDEEVEGIEREPAPIINSRVDERTQDALLVMSESLFRRIQGEARTVLGTLLERRIGEDDLGLIGLEIPAQLAPDTSVYEAALVEDLVTAYLRATLVPDPAATAAARERAAARTAPVRADYLPGDVLVAGGETVDEAAAEALAQMTPRSARVPLEPLAAMLLLGIGASAACGLYLFLAKPDAAASDRRMLLLGFLIVLAVAGARAWFEFSLPDWRAESVDLMVPVAAGPLLIAALLSTELGVMSSVLIAILVGVAAVALPDYGDAAPSGAQAVRPAAVFLLVSLAAVLASTRAQVLSQFGLTGLAAGLAAFLAGLAFWLFDGGRETIQLGWLGLAAVAVAVGTAIITIGAFSLLGAVFGITTRMQLIELAQLERPLLRRLQEEAPGTFHHSLLVATLGERAAAQINANALLVRVGAYYHDIGKLHSPGMFIENQTDGSNPHEQLEPRESAHVIIEHVRHGEALARSARLPARIRAFITEHHGTRRVTYFYRKAVMADPRTAVQEFTYEGPSPQTRETAIVMLADSCEAVVRASEEHDDQTIGLLVDSVIDERVRERQLHECDITMRELQEIGESFKSTLRGVYHARIQYPEPPAAELAATGVHSVGAAVASAPSEVPVHGSE